MRPPLEFSRGDAFELGEFLRAAGLSAAGIGEPGLALWIDLDPDGRIVGSTGFELVGRDALLRSVAVGRSLRSRGRGSELVEFALAEAGHLGAERAWALTRRTGPFWEALGFAATEGPDLAERLADTHLVRSLVASGLLRYETAWSRPLTVPSS